MALTWQQCTSLLLQDPPPLLTAQSLSHLQDAETKPLGPLFANQTQPGVEGREHTRHPAASNCQQDNGPNLHSESATNVCE